MKKWKQIFTLMELMIVVAIIMLMVSMLLPSLQKSRAVAKRIKCAGTLKQVGLCSVSYQGDCSDWIAPSYWPSSPCGNYPAKFVGNNWAKSFWHAYLAIYAPQIFTRPTIKAYASAPMCDETYDEQGRTTNGVTADFIASHQHGAYAYPQTMGYASAAIVFYPMIKSVSVKKPGSTWILIDSYVYTFAPGSFTFWSDVRARRHLKTANALFHDGHVSTSKFADPQLNYYP